MEPESVYGKIIGLLNDKEVFYKEIEHPPAASAIEYQRILKTRLEQQAKALLLRYKKTGEKGFVIVTLQAHKKANLSILKKKIKAKTLKMAQNEQLRAETGCNFGELPPIGSIFGMNLLFDQELLSEKNIYFNAGRLDRSLALDPQDLVKIENPLMF